MTSVQRSDNPPAQRAPRFGSVTVRQRLGALLLAAVILVVIAHELWPDGGSTPPQPEDLTVVNGYGGGLKVDFLNDPEVATILAERYEWRVEIKSRGSNEIACDTPLGPDDDFVWLGDSVVLELHKTPE